MRQALRVKNTRFKKHSVEIDKALHVLNPYYGIKPQYQRAEVPPGGDCETVDPTVATGYFYEQTSGQLDVAVNGAGRVGTNCARLTQTARHRNSRLSTLRQCGGRSKPHRSSMGEICRHVDQGRSW